MSEDAVPDGELPHFLGVGTSVARDHPLRIPRSVERCVVYLDRVGVPQSIEDLSRVDTEGGIEGTSGHHKAALTIDPPSNDRRILETNLETF